MTFNCAVDGTSGIRAQSALVESATALRLTLAKVPQVDHRVCENFEGIMQRTYAFKPKQQTTELILPTKHALDRIEPLFENGGVEKRLAASLGGFSPAWIGVDVGDHAAIENCFAVLPAIIDAIQADDGPLEAKANRMGEACHLRQGFAKHRRFIAIAGCCNKWRNHIAIAVAESDDLIAFHFLVAAEPNVVATFLRRRCRPIPMNDGRVEKICLKKGRYRPGKNGVKTTIGLPSSKGAVNSRVMNFRVALPILFDRQLLPLAAHVKLLQNVIEDCVQGKLRGRTATARA